MGSSPRVRGKPVGERGRCFAGGLIPARAGKTQRACLPASTRTAHPRACGENAQCSPRGWDRCGSSPRVRGKPEPRDDRRGVGGLIPARAGKTRTRATSPTAPWAHPRACGENLTALTAELAMFGSSPRVRGKRKPPRSRGRVGRLIPARAGKTVDRVHAGLQSRAHPRACGENGSGRGLFTCAVGSSPRVRGKPGPPVRNGSIEGLIPARAGKTQAARTLDLDQAAHPRACGENFDLVLIDCAPSGSSPRVRGKRQAHGTTARGQRLIPARAGKTRCHRGCHLLLRAHPRACGENVVCSTTSFTFPGSSPRVRGKRSDSHRGRSRAGLIPARAGKTGGSVCRSRSPRAHPRACGENARARCRRR